MSFHPVEYVKTQLLIRPIFVTRRLAAGMVVLAVLACALVARVAISHLMPAAHASVATPHPQLKEAQAAVRDEPQKPHAHAMLGFALYDLKRYGEAEQEFRNAIRMAQPIPLSGEDARRAEIPLMELCLGRCLLAEHRSPEARTVLEGVVDLDPPGDSGHPTPGVEARDLLAGMN
jgi:hypothetical protein